MPLATSYTSQAEAESEWSVQTPSPLPLPLTIETSGMGSFQSSATMGASATLVTTPTSSPVRRQLFWRNIVKQFNFSDGSERTRIISLTRGVIWMKMSVLPRSFVKRHREIYHLISSSPHKRSSMIERDVTRTFSVFEKSQVAQKDLRKHQRALFRVLNALSEAEDGYCQGMNFIAAVFLVEGLDEADAYVLFLYLLRKRHLARMYRHRSTFLDDYLHHFELMLKHQLPDLYHHLQSQGFLVPMYGIEWFTTLFSVSTKLDLACAVMDMFLVGIQDVFLRIGLAILKLLESKLMCMNCEEFLRGFKPAVHNVDPYQVVLEALQLPSNPHVSKEDTIVFISRRHFQLTLSLPLKASLSQNPPRSFELHRSLPLALANAIAVGDEVEVTSLWSNLVNTRISRNFSIVLSNEILHYAIRHGQVMIARFAIERGLADVNNQDDTNLTPLHFGVIWNQPDLIRLLLCFGADPRVRGGLWMGGSMQSLTPLETAIHWKFGDTSAARAVLDHDVCFYCNQRFETLSFNKYTCSKCRLSYCRGSNSCLTKHLCISTEEKQRFMRKRVLHEIPGPLCDNDHPEYRFVHGFDRITASRTTNDRDHDEPENSPSSIFESAFSHWNLWFGNTSPSSIDRSLHVEDSCMCSPATPSSIDGSKMMMLSTPCTWNCNYATCHQTFAFFFSGTQCKRCGGSFCSAHFNSRANQCVSCNELLLQEHS